jgi:hypothetical protein
MCAGNRPLAFTSRSLKFTARLNSNPAVLLTSTG